MIRLFIGIKASENLILNAVSWQEKYKEKLKVRWISKNNLHITLIPPWYEEKSNVNNLIDNLEAKTFNIEPFYLRFDTIKFGPKEKFPRLIWAKGQAPEEMTRLKSIIENASGIRSEKRNLKLHLTIARFKIMEYFYFPIKNINEKIDWKMKVDSFCLFESKLYTTGAEYNVLKEFKL